MVRQLYYVPIAQLRLWILERKEFYVAHGVGGCCALMSTHTADITVGAEETPW